MYVGDGDSYGVNLSFFVHFINEICNGQDSFKVFLLLIMINIPHSELEFIAHTS